jgi:hypothetical protein
MLHRVNVKSCCAIYLDFRTSIITEYPISDILMNSQPGGIYGISLPCPVLSCLDLFIIYPLIFLSFPILSSLITSCHSLLCPLFPAFSSPLVPRHRQEQGGHHPACEAQWAVLRLRVEVLRLLLRPVSAQLYDEVQFMLILILIPMLILMLMLMHLPIRIPMSVCLSYCFLAHVRSVCLSICLSLCLSSCSSSLICLVFVLVHSSHRPSFVFILELFELSSGTNPADR